MYPQYPHSMQDDEIDLFELASKLWARKLTIAGLTAAVAIAAVIIALIIPPTWQSEARIYKATSTELAPLHSIQQQMGIAPTTSDESFSVFNRYLNSPSTLRSVFEASGLAMQALEASDSANADALLAANFKDFSKDLAIKRSDAKKDGDEYTNVSYESNDQAFSASLINDYLLPAAQQRTVTELSGSLSSALAQQISQINRNIETIESKFVQTVNLDIMKSEQALALAQRGGISTLSTDRFTRITDETLFQLGTNILSKKLEQQRTLLDQYRLISTPKAGDTDKPLLSEVIPLYLKLQNLKALDTRLENLKPVNIDEPAMVPATPIKPKKTLIVALGIVLGGMLGVFVALIQIAIANRKEKQRINVGAITPTQTLTPEQEMEALRK
ncbi:Wzz/FepE/Etk N-terminal domain-containing protein [Parendozoicomonas haliclonae]|uniref:Lipopolysaccharide biosynthesis protein WzzE n=2 Tax=Parendozoicomonas haliclonae TaxID=1960125 RepID=A0A1X7AS21_9GAMM|nr:Lipopolysaccharide biosynthesis protein WzzE [Parendozoicomonas haliclonae]